MTTATVTTSTDEVLSRIDEVTEGVPALTPTAATRRQAGQHTPPEFVPVVNRQLPWAGLVTGSADEGETLSSASLVTKAGLNWEVKMRPLFRQTADGVFEPHKTARETYRSTDGYPLGVVRGHYETFSNREVFAFGDGIVESGQGRWVDAGEQRKGSAVFMTMLLKEFSVLGNDLYKLYLFLRASHDGSTGLNAWILPFRVICMNQMGLVNTSHLGHWTVQHVSTIRERAAEAQVALTEAVNYEEQFQALAEKLAGTRVSDQKVRSVLNRVVPQNRNRRDDVIADLRHVYETSSTLADFRGTAYGLLNAVTEYYDHYKRQNNPNARFTSIMLGEGAKARTQALRDLAGLN